VIVNGKKRFKRALYGTNTAFRAEAGDLPLNKNKELKNLVLKTIANDVVIGLMAVALLR
jgi:hypothetical protein